MPDYSSFGLKDKIAIVTGASQGIGRAVAMGLAEAGAHLVLAKYPGPRMDEIQQVQREIEALGRKALVIVTDVNKVEDCRSLIDQTVAAYGRVVAARCAIICFAAAVLPGARQSANTRTDSALSASTLL